MDPWHIAGSGNGAYLAANELYLEEIKEPYVRAKEPYVEDKEPHV